ncbi:SEC-C domain-containing protein [Thiohalocapsa marina]|uniref:SEC-C domain-containing protein n=1 Tax=Thiohalocapsa marina TaxID=424902 RepID=A0A5M8FPB5_9GAMM|nr:SEC-C domain-containing protein [Thiohalocapsa marina]KAA6186647.1 SEC-C domain-containing protein [Thiohalocapsa marina]
MNLHEQSAPLSMDQLIGAAVRHILRHRDFDRFLDWVQQTLPAVADPDDELAAEDLRRLGVLLAVAIWRLLPRPEHGFRPMPVPRLVDAAPCPCGSGARYGDCCGPDQQAFELPADLVWEALLEALSDAQLRRALQARVVPGPLLARVADRWLEADHPGRVPALLEPLFAGDLRRLDARYEPALDALCDAYDALDHHKKKPAFLRRVAEEGCAPLKSAAWQRLSTQSMDEGDFDTAFEAFRLAQRHGPDNPGTALLEITLLAAQHRDDHARARALFWQHKLRRAGQADSPVLLFLEQVRVDPQEALVESQLAFMDPLLLRLREWVADMAGRPLPPLDAAASLHHLEQRWRALYPVGKPLSTQLTVAGLDMAWQDDAWLRLLEQQPQAADSLDVLDDVATAIYGHPESSLPWVARVLYRPLLERAMALIRHSLTGSGSGPMPLCWQDAQHRATLRLLFRLYLQYAEAAEQAQAAAVLELLLELNPADNHGVRAELMNHYLRRHEDEKALALARQFPADRLADLAYGEVLALYRLGREERAARALRDAVGRLPQIPRFLLRKRIKRPARADGRPSPGLDDQSAGTGDQPPGTEDQAWLYRQAMRDVWEEEPGLLAWMKRQTA